MSLQNRIYKTDTSGDDGAIVDMSFEQYKARSGLSFVSTYTKLGGASTTVSVLITAPTTGNGIYTIGVECEANLGGTFTFSEAPNATATGATAIVNYCTDRTSTNGATALTMVGTPTFTSAGTILENHLIGSLAATGTALGDAKIKTKQYRLASGVAYLAMYTPSTASTTVDITISSFRET